MAGVVVSQPRTRAPPWAFPTALGGAPLASFGRESCACPSTPLFSPLVGTCTLAPSPPNPTLLSLLSLSIPFIAFLPHALSPSCEVLSFLGIRNILASIP